MDLRFNKNTRIGLSILNWPKFDSNLLGYNEGGPTMTYDNMIWALMVSPHANKGIDN